MKRRTYGSDIPGRSTPLFPITAVEPTGSNFGGAFVSRKDGCSVEFADRPTYARDPRGDAFRRARQDAGIFLVDAARILGITVVDVSGLEHGRVRFVDDGDWERAMRIVASPRAGSE